MTDFCLIGDNRSKLLVEEIFTQHLFGKRQRSTHCRQSSIITAMSSGRSSISFQTVAYSLWQCVEMKSLPLEKKTLLLSWNDLS